MIGVVTVRDGRLTLGAADVAARAVEVWLVGSGVATASAPENTTRRLELGEYAPAAWASWLAGQLGDRSVLLSAAPDGRDLAGRLAERLGRELHAGCLDVSADQVVTAVFGGVSTLVTRAATPFVATVQASTSTIESDNAFAPGEVVSLERTGDVVVLDVLEPDLESVDLADAARIVSGGAGLASAADFSVLAEAGHRLGAAMGATRVITDRGWVPFRRQIGTTGATVSPRLYMAFGVSGAIQHTAGLGSPERIISVNTDPACPMSLMADLAVVADAAGTLRALNDKLGSST